MTAICTEFESDPFLHAGPQPITAPCRVKIIDGLLGTSKPGLENRSIPGTDHEVEIEARQIVRKRLGVTHRNDLHGRPMAQ